MKISKVDNVRFYKTYSNGSLVKFENNAFEEIDKGIHITQRFNEAKDTFSKIFTMVKKRSDVFAKKLSVIIKQFLIDNSEKIKNKELKIQDIIFLNETISKANIFLKALDGFLLTYKEKIEPIALKQKSFAFDVLKLEKINKFFLSLYKKYDKEYKTKKSDSKHELINSLNNNNFAFKKEKIEWLKMLDLKETFERADFLILGENAKQFENEIAMPKYLKEIIIENYKTWNKEVWYDCLNYSKNIFSKLSTSLDKKTKYAYNVIVNLLKEVIIDLKPKDGKNCKYEYLKDAELSDFVKLISVKTKSRIKNYYMNNIIAYGKYAYIIKKFGINENDINGTYYELQKACDEIKLRNTTAITFATNTLNNLFNKSIEDDFCDSYDLNKEINFDKTQDLYLFFTIQNVKKKIDEFENNKKYNEFAKQYIKCLYQLRNSNFHFKEDKIPVGPLVKELIEIELQNYSTVLKEKIVSTQCDKYYNMNDVITLFKSNFSQKNKQLHLCLLTKK